MSTFAVISPIDGCVVASRRYASAAEIARTTGAARQAQRGWRTVPAGQRVAVCRAFAAAMRGRKEEIGRELTLQMGRPLRYAPLEVERMAERAETMADIAEGALADIAVAPRAGFTRFIRREPLGIVLVVAPWNYPYLTAVNAVVPAILAGNAVILKHSSQTPLVAERFAEGFSAAGLPKDVFQVLHATHADTERLIASGEIDFVAFTGSVEGGRRMQRAASDSFAGSGLELGGKDPAYVRGDADLAHAVENLVDGSFFNSGQSCCGIERIYVQQTVYASFVDQFAELTGRYVLGNPLEPKTTLGPMVRSSAADLVRAQTAQALAAGATALIDPARFPENAVGTPYLAPQVLTGVDHAMDVMREESFGPVVGIMPVRDDEEAVRLMNDSHYGLTASIWTQDEQVATALGDRLETGTVFMNRCDYLDPELAWVGVKDSGRGCTLSRLGFEQLTRPKSFHLRTVTS
jgi:acyl-CoA reductase-like NAD-dependent aldehyde dehydrogenase